MQIEYILLMSSGGHAYKIAHGTSVRNLLRLLLPLLSVADLLDPIQSKLEIIPVGSNKQTSVSFFIVRSYMLVQAVYQGIRGE